MIRGMTDDASLDRARSANQVQAHWLGAFEKGQLGRYMLLPGDPDRVTTMADQWDSATEYPLARGMRLALGEYRGTAISAFSTGMGSPSAEIALNEVASLGADTFIRVGTTGALQPGLNNGELVINEACVRLDGTSPNYARPEYPAAASYEVTLALIQAAEGRKEPHHVGVGATTSSFYAGQGRSSYNGFRGVTTGIVEEMQAAGVLNFEMEGAALLTMSRLFGLRAGVVCSIIAQRIDDVWEDAGGVERACRVAAEAVHLLDQWDQLKAQNNKCYYSPALS